jgi:hypothetical protein
MTILAARIEDGNLWRIQTLRTKLVYVALYALHN